MSEEVSIFWFRRDLRLQDNIGLYHALKSGLAVVPIFIFDTTILNKLDKIDRRVQFIHDTISALKTQLIELGSDLIVLSGPPKEVMEDLISRYNIETIYSNEDYEPLAIKRDLRITSLLKKNGINHKQFKDQCIFAKEDILKNDGKPYTVYTPYKNKWLEKLSPESIASYDTKKLLKNFKKIKSTKLISMKELGFELSPYPKQIRTIRTKLIKQYDKNRDFPALDATTKLSIHLRFGTISVRKCVQVAYELNDTWLSELIWREFFMQILYNFPHSAKEEFKSKYAGIRWDNDKSLFKKWCEGRTGYPLVDAGMRELNETGFMHNRVRMIVASFLIKDLLIDWRWGEKYFAKKLLDYDQSANIGNWQWAAGSGCDASPYFRIFNPMTQLKKFDPDHKYIKRWIPEFGTEDYPEQIVDHAHAYHRCLQRYRETINK